MSKRTSRKNVNFRETNSERSATASYKSFGKYLKQNFRKIVKF
jgi:hypothetical protein